MSSNPSPSSMTSSTSSLPALTVSGELQAQDSFILDSEATKGVLAEIDKVREQLEEIFEGEPDFDSKEPKKTGTKIAFAKGYLRRLKDAVSDARNQDNSDQLRKASLASVKLHSDKLQKALLLIFEEGKASGKWKGESLSSLASAVGSVDECNKAVNIFPPFRIAEKVVFTVKRRHNVKRGFYGTVQVSSRDAWGPSTLTTQLFDLSEEDPLLFLDSASSHEHCVPSALQRDILTEMAAKIEEGKRLGEDYVPVFERLREDWSNIQPFDAQKLDAGSTTAPEPSDSQITSVNQL